LWECDAVEELAPKNFVIKTRTIANATGPWANGVPHSRVKLRLSKGAHVVVEGGRAGAADAVVMTEGKRILFAIPWGDRTILGTTDTDYNGPLDKIFADDLDIHYILDVTNRFFPRAKLAAGDIMSAWAGVRPLIANPGSAPSDISRSHQIRNPEPGWWDVAGGKLTTYRLMAEQTVDQIVRALRRKGWNGDIAGCSTSAEPLLPAAETEGVSGILPPEFSRETVRHFCQNEWAAHLEDVMLRRTSWHFYCPDAVERAQQASQWMAEVLNWTESIRIRQIENYHGATRAPKA